MREEQHIKRICDFSATLSKMISASGIINPPIFRAVEPQRTHASRILGVMGRQRTRSPTARGGSGAIGLTRAGGTFGGRHYLVEPLKVETGALQHFGDPAIGHHELAPRQQRLEAKHPWLDHRMLDCGNPKLIGGVQARHVMAERLG